MKLIGWQNGRCGVVWRGVAIESADMMDRRCDVPSKSLRFFVIRSFDCEGRFMSHIPSTNPMPVAIWSRKCDLLSLPTLL